MYVLSTFDSLNELANQSTKLYEYVPASYPRKLETLFYFGTGTLWDTPLALVYEHCYSDCIESDLF